MSRVAKSAPMTARAISPVIVLSVEARVVYGLASTASIPHGSPSVPPWTGPNWSVAEMGSRAWPRSGSAVSARAKVPPSDGVTTTSPVAGGGGPANPDLDVGHGHLVGQEGEEDVAPEGAGPRQG